jgi:hypothetical protein
MQGDEPRPIYNWPIPMMEQLLRRLSQYLALVVSSIAFPEIVGIGKHKSPEGGENNYQRPNEPIHGYNKAEFL